MKEHRALWVYLAVYALVVLSLFLWMDITISNGYQRSVSGAFISEYVKGEGVSTNLEDLKNAFTEGHRHYKIFTGIADWPPLQLMLLTVSFLIFGLNKFAFTIIPLVVTLVTLAYLYFVVLLAYDRTQDKKHSTQVALLAVLLVSISTFFFYESGSAMLENGLALFTLASIYHFTRWLRTDENKQFYLLCVVLGLGFLWKLVLVLVLPSLGVAFLMSKGWKQKLQQAKTYKLLAIGALIFIAILSPMIARDAVLSQYGVVQTDTQNFNKIAWLFDQSLDTSTYPGYASAWDFEFVYGLPAETVNVIFHRYDISLPQKVYVVLSSLFLNWVFLPLLVLGIVIGRAWKKERLKSFSDVEIMLSVFLIVNCMFFALLGLIPRYMIPATIVLAVFAARGLIKLKEQRSRAGLVLIVVSILLIGATSACFMLKVHNNDHIQSMQHDYKGAVAFIMGKADKEGGEFTVITTRQYQMAFYFLKADPQEHAYVELMPQKQETLVQMLNGNFPVSDEIKNAGIAYNATLPAAKFVVVHERVELGAVQTLHIDDTDFDAKAFMDAYPGAQRSEIPSAFPNSRTWVYELASVAQ